jgi:opacity protein-like surface antigen
MKTIPIKIILAFAPLARAFFEYSPRVNYSFQPYSERIEREVVGVSPRGEEREHKHRSFWQTLTPQISLGIGYGRIEPVGDARHAIHILDALARRGVTSVHKSPDDIIRFAEFIANLKNKRFLDARHRKIYEMKALDSFLLANGFRDTLSMEYIMDYVTTLEDFWVHGNESRHSGWRMSLYATPVYSFESVKIRNWLNGNITEDIYRNDHILSTRFGINFAYEKPINLYWQNSFSSSLEYRLQNTKRNRKNNLRDEKHKDPPVLLQGFSYSLGQQISYHPTTRTSAFVNYGLSYAFFKQITNHSEDLMIEGIGHNLGVSAGAGVSYFLSPQLQLNLLTSLHYDF